MFLKVKVRAGKQNEIITEIGLNFNHAVEISPVPQVINECLVVMLNQNKYLVCMGMHQLLDQLAVPKSISLMS